MEDRPQPLKGLTVCTTGLTSTDKSQIEAKAKALGAKCSGAFIPEICTHLIAAEVGSMKYRAAMEKKIPVVKPDWVISCYEMKRLLPITSFGLGPFSGLHLTITGLQNEREEIRKLIEGGDGMYSGSLVLRKTTHLVASEPIGPKYEAALANNLKIVIPQWVSECRRLNRWLSEDDYELAMYENVGSPSKAETDTARKIIERKLKEEQNAERIKKAEEEARRLEERTEAEEQLLKDYLEGNSDILDVLEPCWIYLHGFEPKRMRRMADIVQCSGASLLFECHPCVTHAVVGDSPNKQHLTDIRQLAPSMKIVQAQWLFDSFHDHCRHDEATYLFFQPKKAATATRKASALASKDRNTLASKDRNLENERIGTNRPEKRERDEKLNDLAFSAKKRKKADTLPLAGELICVSRYMGEERERVKVLTEKLGGTFTDRLTRKNPQVTYLVSANKTGLKCEKAKEWSIPVKNLQWLESFTAA